MTCIAWDGKTLAADRQGTNNGLKISCTKIKRIKGGAVVAFTGELEKGIELAKWLEDGEDPSKWPSYQGADDWTRMIVAKDGHIFIYEQRPVPQPVEDKFAAWGSGRDFAIGALAMGADARTAVRIASEFNVGSGMGIDSFEVGNG